MKKSERNATAASTGEGTAVALQPNGYSDPRGEIGSADLGVILASLHAMRDGDLASRAISATAI